MFLLLSFLFFFLENQRIGRWDRFCPKEVQNLLGEEGKGGGVGESGWRMNMVQIMCTHVSKLKSDTC
jgi:hypothetical protein